MRTAKTQIRLGIWQRRLWSDWADAQSDLSLHLVYRSFCWFWCAAARYTERYSVTTCNITLVLNLKSWSWCNGGLSPSCSLFLSPPEETAPAKGIKPNLKQLKLGRPKQQGDQLIENSQYFGFRWENWHKTTALARSRTKICWARR